MNMTSIWTCWNLLEIKNLGRWEHSCLHHTFPQAGLPSRVAAPHTSNLPKVSCFNWLLGYFMCYLIPYMHTPLAVIFLSNFSFWENYCCCLVKWETVLHMWSLLYKVEVNNFWNNIIWPRRAQCYNEQHFSTKRVIPWIAVLPFTCVSWG